MKLSELPRRQVPKSWESQLRIYRLEKGDEVFRPTEIWTAIVDVGLLSIQPEALEAQHDDM